MKHSKPIVIASSASGGGENRIDIGAEVFAWGCQNANRAWDKQLVNGILVGMTDEKEKKIVYKILHKDGNIFYSHSMVFDQDNYIYDPEINQLYKIYSLTNKSINIENVSSKKRHLIRAENKLVILPKKGDCFFYGEELSKIEEVSLYFHGIVFTLENGLQVPRPTTNNAAYTWVPEKLKHLLNPSARRKKKMTSFDHIKITF